MKKGAGRLLLMLRTIACLTIFAWPLCKAENAGNSNLTAGVQWSINIPKCRKDIEAWRRYSPLEEWMDRREANWRDKPESVAYFKKYRELDRKAWRKEDVVDETWTDIDGDGWCDVITSGEKETYKSIPGKPVLLTQPRGIYIRTPTGFKAYKPGMISGEFEGRSFTLYWNQEEKLTVIVMRVYQGNLMDAGGQAENEFHYRQLLAAAFSALASEEDELFSAYYQEAGAIYI